MQNSSQIRQTLKESSMIHAGGLEDNDECQPPTPAPAADEDEGIILLDPSVDGQSAGMMGQSSGLMID